MPITSEDPIELMAKAMLTASKEEGLDLDIELLKLFAVVALQALKPSQIMASCGANCLEDVLGDESDRQELAKIVFEEMVLAAVQEPIVPTNEGNSTEN